MIIVHILLQQHLFLQKQNRLCVDYILKDMYSGIHQILSLKRIKLTPCTSKDKKLTLRIVH